MALGYLVSYIYNMLDLKAYLHEINFYITLPNNKKLEYKIPNNIKY